MHASPVHGQRAHCVRTTPVVRQRCGAEHLSESRQNHQTPDLTASTELRLHTGRRSAALAARVLHTASRCNLPTRQPATAPDPHSHRKVPTRLPRSPLARSSNQTAPAPPTCSHRPPPTDHPATPASTDNLKNTVHSLLYAEGSSSLCAEESSSLCAEESASLCAEEASSRLRARAVATASRCA